MDNAKVFSDFFLGAALSVQVAISVPLAIYYSQPRSTRLRMQPWFTWPAALLTSAITAYLIAGVDYRFLGQPNVLDVFVLALVLLAVLAVIVVVIADRRGSAAAVLAPDPAAGAASPEHTAAPATGPATAPTPAPATAPATAGADPPPDRTACKVAVCTSSTDYSTAILSIEREAMQVDRMTKRVSAIFKDPTEVEAIAAKRFGPGSRQGNAYIAEHRERHRIMMEKLTTPGFVCREIYQISELKRYFRERSHGTDVVLERSLLRRTAMEWLRVLESFENYYVGLTTVPIPLKYQLYDQRTVVIHEAAGSYDGQRLNSIIVRDDPVIGSFQTDFERVWEQIPPDMRSRDRIDRWVRTNLLRLLEDDESGDG